MAYERQLFIEDLKGLNGTVAQELAIEEALELIDCEFSLDEIQRMDEALDENADEIVALEDVKEKLLKQIARLEKENRELKKENFSLGNFLDHIVVEKRIEVFS